MGFLDELLAKVEQFAEQSAVNLERAQKEQAAQEKLVRRGEPRRQKHRPEEGRSSRQPVGADVCPVVEAVGEDGSRKKQSESRAAWIFDNLHERLGEGFLLQEVLGPPRCLREFE